MDRKGEASLSSPDYAELFTTNPNNHGRSGHRLGITRNSA
jgi:hypothetical protein